MTSTVLPPAQSKRILVVLHEVFGERRNQLAKWGEQSHPDGTSAEFAADAIAARKLCEAAAALDRLTWLHILLEEVAEAAAETEWPELRAELVQVAAVAAAWIEDGDRRAAA